MFEKTHKQKQAIDLIGSGAKNIMLYGGSRSGKSFIALYAIFVRACKAPSRHACLRLRFNHIKTSLWLDTARKVHSICFPDCGAQFNGSDYYISFPNGSEIWFAGLDNADRTEKILGKEYSTLFFNECSQLGLAEVNTAKTRLAQKNDLRKISIYDQNPPSKKHWAYYIFERRWDPVSEKAVDENDYVKIHMNPKDNLANIDSGYLEMLETLPEKQKQRFLYGEYTDAEDGQVYYCFDSERHVKEIPELRGTYWVGVDFNVDPSTAVICRIADDKIYVVDEVFQRNSDTFKLSKEIRAKCKGQVRIAPDSTGKNRKTSGKSDFHILQQEFGSNVLLPTRNPFVTDRVNNLNRLFAEDRIVISPKCRKLINDLERVFWRGNELDKRSDPLLTHVSDSLGYLAWHQMPYINTYESDIIIT